MTALTGATVTGTNIGISADTTNVTNFGSIAATAANGLGVSANIANVANSGSISATGANGVGIGAFIATVSNSGTISGGDTGVGATTANVTNSGTISGATHTGIGAVTANVTNTGTISGGDTGVGATTANVTNTGTISGGDTGVGAATTANINNTGTISGGNVGIGAAAVNVTNSGTISGRSFGVAGATVGLFNAGIILGNVGVQSGVGSVTNSGIIIGTGGTALQFGGAADALTLLPGSRIIGAIDMGGGPDVVNIITGRDISWLVTLSNFSGTINVSGGQPFVISGNQIATLDPTPFAMVDRTLMDFSRLVSLSVPVFEGWSGVSGQGASASAAPDTPFSRIENSFAAAIPGFTAYTHDPLLFKNPTVVYADGSALWARGFAGERFQKPDGVLFGATNRYYGGMIGGDWQAWPDLRLRAFVGAGATRTDIDFNAGATDSDLVFGGGFARYTLGASVLHLGMQGGASRNDTSRLIASNIAPNLQTATANYFGWYVSPELGYWLRYGLGTFAGATYTLTPNLRVRYLYGSFDGYRETGSAANLTVAGRDVQNVEERGEVRLTAQTGAVGGQMTRASVYGGVLGVQRVGDFTVNSILLGQPLPFATLGKGDVWGGFAGGEAEARFGSFALFAGGEWLALSDDSTIVSGKAGLRVGF